MVRESTMICIDTSEYMRNGDFLPSRLHAQQDAVYVLARSKFRSNPENKIGLLSLVNKQVLINLSNDIGGMYSKLQTLQPNGEINLYSGIKTAHLALRHREEKSHKMRLVVFVGSPVVTETHKFIQLAKQLKKEKVNVDIVSFGEHDINSEILNTFISELNGKDGTNNHLVAVPEGCNLADAVIYSPVIEGVAAAQALLERSTIELGFDPAEDPELAMALLLSLQEEEARAARAETGHPTVVEEPIQVIDATSSKQVDNDSLSNFDVSELSELKQFLFAMKLSLQTEPSSETEISDETFLQLINDPEFLEDMINSWPELASQTDNVQETIKKLKDNRNREDNNGSDDDKSQNS